MNRLPAAVRTSILLLPTLFVAGQSPAAQAQPPTSAQNSPMPDERFYSLVFRHMLYLQNLGAPPTQTGSVSSSVQTFTGNRLGASETESAFLTSEASAWKAEVDPIDTQAHNMIMAIRNRNPGGKLAPGEEPPSVPDGLLTLQRQRDDITLAHVDRLHAALGDARFHIIDHSLRQDAHLHQTFRPIPNAK